MARPDRDPGASDSLRVLESQLRECFARTAYSHKTHEKDADIGLARLSRIKLSQIVLSAITTGGLLAVAFGPARSSRLSAGLAALVSTALLALNAYTKENDLGQVAQKHKETADKLWDIRESYLSLLTDLRAHAIALESILERRDRLQEALKGAYQSAPRTSAEGYRRAQKALKVSEDLTFSDEEIDQFLPSPLRRSGQEA